MAEYQNRPSINFLSNVPVEVALKWTDGKIVNGMYGERVMYTTVDERVMFLDPDVAYRIREMDPCPGEPLMICKQRAAGKGAKTFWKIWRAEETQPAPLPEQPRKWPPPKLPPTKYYDPTVEQLEASLKNVAEGKPPAAPRPTPTPAPIAERLNQHPPVNGNGAAKVPPIKPTYAEAMAEFLLLAGRATRETEKTLGAEGAAVKFDSRDVAALATTLFIQAAKEGFLQFKPGGGQ